MFHSRQQRCAPIQTSGRCANQAVSREGREANCATGQQSPARPALVVRVLRHCPNGRLPHRSRPPPARPRLLALNPKARQWEVLRNTAQRCRGGMAGLAASCRRADGAPQDVGAPCNAHRWSRSEHGCRWLATAWRSWVMQRNLPSGHGVRCAAEYHHGGAANGLWTPEVGVRWPARRIWQGAGCHLLAERSRIIDLGEALPRPEMSQSSSLLPPAPVWSVAPTGCSLYSRRGRLPPTDPHSHTLVTTAASAFSRCGGRRN